MKRLLVTLFTIVNGFGLSSISASQADAWKTLMSAIDAGGSNAEEVFALLGTIDNSKARSFLDVTLSGKNGVAIDSVAKGLTTSQCIRYLPQLKIAALDSSVEPKLEVLKAISRAGTTEAGAILEEMSDTSVQPAAGVAIGLLEHMGSLGGSALQELILHGKTPWTRETAAFSLIRMKLPTSVQAFRLVLHDSDRHIRFAGALGLAQSGIAEGESELIAATKGSETTYKIEALVALAALGHTDVLPDLAALATGSDKTLAAQAVWAIARSGKVQLKVFAYRLGLQNKPNFRAMLAEKLLNPADKQDRSVLEKALGDGDQISTLIAANKLLSFDGDSHARAAIITAISSPNEEVRHFALEIASQNSVIWPDLAKRVNDADPQVSVAAINAASELRQIDKMQDLKQFLASDIPAISLAAAKALLAIDPESAKPVFEYNIEAAKINHVRIYSSAMFLAMTREKSN